MRKFRPHSLPEKAHPLTVELFKAMNERQCTAVRLAECAGVSEYTISTWRTSANPRIDNLEACLNVLGKRLAVVNCE